MNTLIVDGDIIAYQAAAACQQPIHWGDGLWTLHAYEDEVYEAMHHHIEGLQETSGLSKVRIALTGKTNFRKEVLESYKGNRKETLRPILLEQAKQHLIDDHGAELVEGLEGDDLMGLAADECVLWSIDKDMKTIPGKHLVDGEIIEISLEEADRFFLTQVLTGDTTDGYSGCPGIGPKTAEKILEESCSWEAVVATYEKKGLTEADALVQARVARILRVGEYTESEGVKLWTPNSN